MTVAAPSPSRHAATASSALSIASVPSGAPPEAGAVATSTAPPNGDRKRWPRIPLWLRRWFDSRSGGGNRRHPNEVDWLRCLPFLAMHIAALGVFWTGCSPVALALGSFLVRIFAITGLYHHNFSHRAFRTSRIPQAAMAFVGGCAAQRDPMWRASHHAQHHSHPDAPGDPHSPSLPGFLGSHARWFMTREEFLTRSRFFRDWARFPELRFPNRFDWAPPLVFAALVWRDGGLDRWQPHPGTNGPQMLAQGGSSPRRSACTHATLSVNALAHGWGRRRFATGDDSRNNWFPALLTLGEGWHNNHHYPVAARQGFDWRELDITYYGLPALERLGLAWDLRPVPEHVLTRNRADTSATRGAP